MLDDDFLKERQNIREKMLRYSRAVKEGRVRAKVEQMPQDDDILKRRLNKNKKQSFDFFDQDFLEPKTKGSIYLKEDLINVKLEEKKKFGFAFLAKFKQKKNKNIKQTSENKRTNSEKQNIQKQSKKEKNKLLQGIIFFGDKKAKTSIQQTTIKQIHTHQINTLQAPNKKEKLTNLNLQTQKNLSQSPNSNHIKSPNLQQTKLPNDEKNQTNLQAQVDSLKQTKASSQILNSKQTHINTNDQSLEQVKSTYAFSPLEQENSSHTKNTLLEGFKEATQEEKNLNFNQLLFAFLLIFFTCVVFIPQIYIRNNIYYLSREIGTLRNQESVLNEENKELKRGLENMRFQNQILDYLE
ncbi:hypothetical protein DMB91_01880 [Campylobacter sp. MIT 97-5078]|nr:hypothetical protein [Campylobacter sp. MIT 97-5078]KGI56473.1 hypothetical protein LR59_07130 [Campylobacter sp. MIT 97-5078]TQR28005.1 hypothetical protein DMB91_01880 [Campylobacter sp. MIT 97-5078]